MSKYSSWSLLVLVEYVLIPQWLLLNLLSIQESITPASRKMHSRGHKKIQKPHLKKMNLHSIIVGSKIYDKKQVFLSFDWFYIFHKLR